MGCGNSSEDSAKKKRNVENTVRRGRTGEVIPQFVGGTTTTVPVASLNSPASEDLTGVVPHAFVGSADAADGEVEMVLVPVDNNLGDKDADGALTRVHSTGDVRSIRNGHSAREPGYDVVRVRCDMTRKRKEEEREERRDKRRQQKMASIVTATPPPDEAVANPLVAVTTPVLKSPSTVVAATESAHSSSLNNTLENEAVTVRSLNHWGADGNYAGPKRPGTPPCVAQVQSWLTQLPDGEGYIEPQTEALLPSSFRVNQVLRTPPPGTPLLEGDQILESPSLKSVGSDSVLSQKSNSLSRPGSSSGSRSSFAPSLVRAAPVPKNSM